MTISRDIRPANFEYLQHLLLDQAGMELREDQRYLVEARLIPLAEEAGAASLDEYIDRVRADRNGAAWRVVEAMANHESTFFRDGHPFAALRDVVLPELIRRRSSCRELWMWSAGCASGQEPYSMAMLVREHFPELESWDLHLIATDISEPLLARAKEGLYSRLEVNRGLPAAYLVKYFDRIGLDWKIKDEIRGAVEFRAVNLMKEWSLPPMDVVFLRNVLIYLEAGRRKEAIARVRRVLRPDGFLFLGGAETTHGIDSAFEPVPPDRSCCYRLKGSPNV